MVHNELNADNAYSLPNKLTIETARTFYASLHESCTHFTLPIRLDGSAIELITTPAIQILIATSKHAQANGVTFTLVNPSAACQQSFHDLGLSDLLSSWSQPNV